MDRYGWLFPFAEAALADALDASFNVALDNVVPLDSHADDAPAAALTVVCAAENFGAKCSRSALRRDERIR